MAVSKNGLLFWVGLESLTRNIGLVVVKMVLGTYDNDFRVRVYCMDIWIQGLRYGVKDKDWSCLCYGYGEKGLDYWI